MNTPAHLALSVFIWRAESTWRAALAVSFGALLPDLPMIGFYFYQKILGTPEHIIWSITYFEQKWQLIFDSFNSIPLFLLLALACYFYKFQLGLLLAASALLHIMFDLPLHHDDAHRHFLPFSDWRFISPISYWDPRHFGSIIVWVELVFALFACSFVCWKGDSKPMRIVAAFTLLAYASFATFAFMHWSGSI